MTAGRFDWHGDKRKFIVIAASISVSTFLTLWFHIVYKTDIYSHFFYVPIVIASFWYQKKGMYVALYLSALQLLVHYYMPHSDMPPILHITDNLVRVSMFMFVSFITATLSKRLTKEQAELKESEERFRNLVETTSDWVWEVDKSGVYTYASPAVRHILGYEPEDVLGKTPFDLMPPEEAKRVAEFFGSLVAERKPINCLENINLHKDSRQVILETCAVPFFDPAGIFIGYRGVDRDITERKKSEEFIKSILESVGEGFIVIGHDYRIISANRAYCEQAKMPLEDIINRHCYEISHHSDKPCFEAGERCAPQHTFATGEPCTELHTHYDKKGNPVYVATRSYPMKDQVGRVISVIEIANDITERKKLEEQLRHAQKMEAIGTLAGGIAHDFNNILNVIIGYGTMLLDRMEADSLSKEQMNEVLMAAERAANLTRGLLVFSRKQVVEVKPVNINETILGIQKMLVRMIRENIDFKLNLTDRPLIVMADTGQIEQVLMNLAANAKDAMPEGGHLTIVTGLQELDDEYVAAYGYGKPGIYALITVTDTGHGMDAETLDKIFEPFFTTKGIGEGTGLGLAICYGIIKQHNGYIKVYSEPGQGAEFTIYLPLVEETAELDKKTEAAVSAKGGNEMILVAEDDPSLRNLARIVLESFGYSVITAEDGEDAITKFIEHRDNIALVVLDMIMPKKSGKDAYEEIRKTSPGVKALLMSGYTIDIIKTSELTEAGFDLIYKPFLPKDFLKKVREVLDR